MWRNNINSKGGLCLDNTEEECADILKRNVSVEMWVYTSVYFNSLIIFII